MRRMQTIEMKPTCRVRNFTWRVKFNAMVTITFTSSRLGHSVPRKKKKQHNRKLTAHRNNRQGPTRVLLVLHTNLPAVVSRSITKEKNKKDRPID